jgi:hypothetical protein
MAGFEREWRRAHAEAKLWETRLTVFDSLGCDRLEEMTNPVDPAGLRLHMWLVREILSPEMGSYGQRVDIYAAV